MVFNHDWWHGGALERQKDQAKLACAVNRFGGAFDPNGSDASAQFFRELETRVVVYLRDGFSYEIKRLVPMESSAFLAFECVSPDENYRVGAFVVSVNYEEVQRVEVFAVHPSERPDETPAIKGFGGAGVPPAGRGDERGMRTDSRELEPADAMDEA